MNHHRLRSGTGGLCGGRGDVLNIKIGFIAYRPSSSVVLNLYVDSGIGWKITY